jgi:tRNA-specific 2-thiouridylase
MDLKGKTVILGMSGGVDSSVAAVLLKERGAKVIGLFMKNWEETDETGNCKAALEYQDVQDVCERIGIPYYSVNFAKEYRQRVFNDFLEGLKKGITPNPDILCNREIKFDAFYKKAITLGADYIATGHYCQNPNDKDKTVLKKGLDPGKDQSYFLHAVKSNILKKVLFPVGNITKGQVREIAAKHDLKTKNKKDSTGICFIGEKNFSKFISQYLKSNPGHFINLKGEIQGTHRGAIFYTIGQRKGLGLGGPGERWYVVQKDIKQNTVTVERGYHHPALYSDSLFISSVSWIDEKFCPRYPLRCKAKIRYRQSDQECILEQTEKGFQVSFMTPQRAITQGQWIVFYQEDICLGGAQIECPGKSYYEQGKKLPDQDF